RADDENAAPGVGDRTEGERSRQRRCGEGEAVRGRGSLAACCLTTLGVRHAQSLPRRMTAGSSYPRGLAVPSGSGQNRHVRAPTSGTKPMTIRLGTKV